MRANVEDGHAGAEEQRNEGELRELKFIGGHDCAEINAACKKPGAEREPYRRRDTAKRTNP
jgi:hypothetical protein